MLGFELSASFGVCLFYSTQSAESGQKSALNQFNQFHIIRYSTFHEKIPSTDWIGRHLDSYSYSIIMTSAVTLKKLRRAEHKVKVNDGFQL